VVGVVVATHGRLAEELVACAQAITGPLPALRSVGLDASVPLEAARQALSDAIRSVDGGRGVVVLTDMLGGTPSNLALGFLAEGVEVVTGVNLPMILKLSTCRSGPEVAADVARLLAAYGQRNIALASELLRARGAPGPG
jgi:PTS system mannose-specific IIA component